MASNDYDYDKIDDAILFLAEDGITHSPLNSPGSGWFSHSPTTRSPWPRLIDWTLPPRSGAGNRHHYPKEAQGLLIMQS